MSRSRARVVVYKSIPPSLFLGSLTRGGPVPSRDDEKSFASQFESLTQPFAIMLSLPISLIGVLLALLHTGSTFNLMSMTGVILLMGHVTKNAILLVDNANARRGAGKDRWTTLTQAGRVRLRPILMRGGGGRGDGIGMRRRQSLNR